MQNFVLAVLEMSLEAVLAIFVMLLLRFGFRKLPKGYTCVLWMIVLIRLLCPVTLDSRFSIMPDMALLQEVQERRREQDAMGDEAAVSNLSVPEVRADAAVGDGRQNAMTDLEEDAAEQKGGREKATFWPGSGMLQDKAAPAAGQFRIFWKAHSRELSLLWLSGTVILASAYLLQYIGWKRRIRLCFQEETEEETAEILTNCGSKKERVLESGNLQEPFVYGIFRPIICLPAGMEEKERTYILCHERMHIRHGDPLLRFLWQTALVFHWFNPFVWLAVSMVQKDMEMFCDESVLKQCGGGARKEYAMTLLHFSVKKSGLPFPVAFGESNTEKRVHHILMVKKPALAASLLAVAAIAAAAVFLLTDPKNPGVQEKNELPMEVQEKSGGGPDSDMARIGTEEKSRSEEQTEQMLSVARQWAEAFSDRNGAAMAALLADPAKLDEYKDEEEGYYSIGWSSPWPWFYDYQISYSYDRDEVHIYYYARTSDPHVWVWREVLTLVPKEGTYMVDDWNITPEEPVASAAAFQERYHYENPEEYGMSGYGYRLQNTPLDMYYPIEDAGTWAEGLLRQEENDPELMQDYWGTPQLAAQMHLDLAGGQAVLVDSPWEDKVCLRWRFFDGTTDVICLAHPYSDAENHEMQESSLWMVENILEEEVYEAELAAAR